LQEAGFPKRLKWTDLVSLLDEKYPDYKWDRLLSLRGRFAQQKRLERAITQIFPVTILTTFFAICLQLVIECGD